MEQGALLNFVLNSLLKKIVVPADFHNRAEAVGTMLEDDVSGLVDSLTSFSVNTADVEFSIETENEQFSKVLKEWLDNVNSAYGGKIPSGIKALAKEYFKERWKGASFPVLRIGEWKTYGKVVLPSKMYFVDGGSIHAKDKEDTDELSLLSYDYYLGAKFDTSKKLDDNCIFAKGGRWFDKYPVPYLIKRGIYHNWKIIQSLKTKETEILDQVIPYMLLIKKGTEQLALKDFKGYSDTELKATIEQLQTLMDEYKSTSTDGKTKTPIRATNFDEELKHFIPDLSTIFEPKLFSVAERGILAGLGFIDVIQGISDTRRESILNPKVFIEETKQGVEDFKQILRELVLLIKEKNKTHIKYMTGSFYITASPIRGFMTDAFKTQMRMLWERGQLSNQTYCEIVGETEYRTEKMRREKEAKDGDEYTMYPHIKDNREGVGIDIPGKQNVDTDKNGKPIPPDKLDDKDKYDLGITLEELELSFKPEITENYIRLRQIAPSKFQKKSFRTITLSETKGIKAIIGRLIGEKTTTVQSYLFDKKKWNTREAQAWVKERKQSQAKLTLEGAPYRTIKDLPDSVKKKLSPTKQKAWMKIFNNAYNFYMKKYGDAKKAESLAFRTAWSQIRQVKAKKKTKSKKEK